MGGADELATNCGGARSMDARNGARGHVGLVDGGHAIMGKGKSRTLTSRKKHFKDVTSATLENTAYHRDRFGQVADAPKKNFDAQVPRKMREMMQAMQRMKDREAGKQVQWRAHREDVPRPNQPKFNKKRKAEAAPSNPDDGKQPRDDDEAESSADKKRQKSTKQAPLPPPAVAALLRGGSSSGADKSAQQQKQQRPGKPTEFAKAKAAKFGSTNDAPPDLRIGSQLKKQMMKQRAKEAMLIQQREVAVAAYANAKKARREEQPQSAEDSSSSRHPGKRMPAFLRPEA